MKKVIGAILALAVIILVAGLVVKYNSEKPAFENKSVVAKTIADKLKTKIKTRPNVSCPTDLLAKVGTTIRCSASLPNDNQIYGVTVVVNSVKDNVPAFTFQVDALPEDAKK